MTIIWIGFILLVIACLFLDLFVLNKKDHVPSTREAVGFTAMWMGVALLFSLAIFALYDQSLMGDGMAPWQAVLSYLSGYLVEFSLSMDNVFVIAMIFAYFNIPQAYQHRVLFWGILGAVFFRGLMVGVGSLLIERFDWMMYVFGALLLFSALRMLRHQKEGEKKHPGSNRTVQFLERFLPVTQDIPGDFFFVRRAGTLMATPVFVALLVVEVSDILFAIDSIPAVLAITHDPFLVFSSNILAVLGLRSLYFVLVAMMNRFQQLHYSLAAILVFVSLKLLLHPWIHLPTWVSPLLIVLLLGGGIGFSFYRDAKREPEPQSEA